MVVPLQVTALLLLLSPPPSLLLVETTVVVVRLRQEHAYRRPSTLQRQTVCRRVPLSLARESVLRRYRSCAHTQQITLRDVSVPLRERKNVCV